MGERSRSNRALIDRILEASNLQSLVVAAADESPIAAATLRYIITRRGADIDPFGIALDGFAIEDELDLHAVDVSFPLHFTRCVFNAPIDIEGSRLRSLALNECAKVPGIAANGIHISRDLDLSGSTISGVLRSAASNSQTAAVWLTEANIGGRLLCARTRIETKAERGIQADRSEFGGNLRFVRGFFSDAELRLLAIRTDGSVDFAGATLSSPSKRTLDLGEARIGGSLFFVDDQDGNETRIDGRVEMGHAVIGGKLFIRNTTIVAPPERVGRHHYQPTDRYPRTAILAPRISVNGDLVAEGSTLIDGSIEMSGAEINGSVSIRGYADTTLSGPSRHLTPSADEPLAGRFRGPTVLGTTSLVGARIRGNIDLAGAQLVNVNGIALNLTRAEIDGTVYIGVNQDSAALMRFQAEGEVRLSGAHIRGNLSAWGARFLNPGGNAVGADGLIVDGTVYFRRDSDHDVPCQIEGTLRFPRVSIAGTLDLRAAEVVQPLPSVAPADTGGSHRVRALHLSAASIGGAVLLRDGCRIDGLIDMFGAQVGGNLSLAGGTFTNTQGERVLNAGSASVRSIVLAGAEFGPGCEISMNGLTIRDALLDEPTGWPARYDINGMHYQRVGRNQDDPHARINWLRGAQGGFEPGTYTQLADYYQRQGDHHAARSVRIAREDARWGDRLQLHRRLLPKLWRLSARYGHEPHRALTILAVLVAIVAIALHFSSDDMAATVADPIRFQPLAYTVSLVVPGLSLAATDQWVPDSATTRALTWTAATIGWLLSFAFIAAISGLFRPRD